ncbi:MAG: N-6 DNA methylase [Elusimicrobia bacterium]|nr:N-6 DNA methylase [Elusimicrobiota bacterium]
MELTIAQLKSKWNKEKERYTSQEVGSGVQQFVKDVLECKEIFNLAEGKLSTQNEKRKDEFICEYKTKSKRRVDIAMFITPEILIPVEVEQYTNIQAGINQLFQYQIDLDRKYGILTDGYTWRFFNNNIYRTFTLKEIFEETKTFLEFWKEYIKPEHYYLSFFETFGQLSLFKDVEKMNVENNRQIFFEDITKLIRSIKEKLKLEGYFNGLDKKAKEKKATEITYAYIIQFILYKALVDNAFKDFGDEYKNYVKRTHEYLKNKQYKSILSIIDNISAKISENIYRPFLEEQKYIFQKIQQLYRKIENKLSDVSLWLDIFVFIKKYRFQNVKNEIFGFIYENYFKELYENDEKRGQYFTDPAVVNFMLQQISYTEKEIKEKIRNDQSDKLSIIDPSCGSGTFLYTAVDNIIKSFGINTKETSEKIEEIVTKNVFGLDINEFPLYLAEMNILMRMLPCIISEKYNNPVDKKIKVFLTNDSIAEFVSTPIDNTEVDEYVRVKSTGNGVADAQMIFPGLSIQEPEFDSFMRVSSDIQEMKESLKGNHIPRRRFDYVIGNPPYIGYNECSKQGVLIFKMLQGKEKPKVTLNNIYGINLHSVPSHRKKYAPKPNLYSFFIAIGLALLKDNGKLCYIIPQTILTAGDLDVLRYHLAKYVTIEKIITFNSNLFISRGLNQKKVIPTSSLIFVVSKKPPTNTHQVEIINYKNGEDTINETLANILKNRKIDKKKIPQSELLKNVVNWNFIKQDKVFPKKSVKTYIFLTSPTEHILHNLAKC